MRCWSASRCRSDPIARAIAAHSSELIVPAKRKARRTRAFDSRPRRQTAGAGGRSSPAGRDRPRRSLYTRCRHPAGRPARDAEPASSARLGGIVVLSREGADRACERIPVRRGADLGVAVAVSFDLTGERTTGTHRHEGGRADRDREQLRLPHIPSPLFDDALLDAGRQLIHVETRRQRRGEHPRSREPSPRTPQHRIARATRRGTSRGARPRLAGSPGRGDGRGCDERGCATRGRRGQRTSASSAKLSATSSFRRASFTRRAHLPVTGGTIPVSSGGTLGGLAAALPGIKAPAAVSGFCDRGEDWVVASWPPRGHKSRPIKC